MIPLSVAVVCCLFYRKCCCVRNGGRKSTAKKLKIKNPLGSWWIRWTPRSWVDIPSPSKRKKNPQNVEFFWNPRRGWRLEVGHFWNPRNEISAPDVSLQGFQKCRGPSPRLFLRNLDRIFEVLSFSRMLVVRGILDCRHLRFECNCLGYVRCMVYRKYAVVLYSFSFSLLSKFTAL